MAKISFESTFSANMTFPKEPFPRTLRNLKSSKEHFLPPPCLFTISSRVVTVEKCKDFNKSHLSLFIIIQKLVIFKLEIEVTCCTGCGVFLFPIIFQHSFGYLLIFKSFFHFFLCFDLQCQFVLQRIRLNMRSSITKCK